MRSPIKYDNGNFKLPLEPTIPDMSKGKPFSAHIIEGNVRGQGRNQASFRGKNERLLATEANFFDKNAVNVQTEAKERKTEGSKRLRNNFPQIMEKLMEQTQGSFSKAGAEKYISQFFEEDYTTSPRYRHDQDAA